MSVATGIGLVLLGVIIGTLAGLLGIGGGALAVPALSILSDRARYFAACHVPELDHHQCGEYET